MPASDDLFGPAGAAPGREQRSAAPRVWPVTTARAATWDRRGAGCAQGAAI